MPFIDSYPEDADPIDVYMAYPETYDPWMKVQNAVMRGPSPLTVQEREIIAAYVSGLNACDFCYDGHVFMAEALGVDAGLIGDLMEDVDGSAIDEKLKPLLRFVKKLTLEPGNMRQADADAVFVAGWDGKALHDAVAVCAMFSFMNRLVDGLGILPADMSGPDAKVVEASAEAIRTLDYETIAKGAIAARGKLRI